jgi:hypothetical protein
LLRDVTAYVTRSSAAQGPLSSNGSACCNTKLILNVVHMLI